MAGETVFTVTRLNEYASSILKNDPRLRSIRVSGEISGFKRHSSGHLYFNLKDEGAVIACVMFRSAAQKLGFDPHDGLQVVIRGSVSIFARDGKYQLYAEAMRVSGSGELYRQFLLLKAKLDEEGVFANARELPRIPRAIGVATSETGAAIRDIVTVIRRRFPKMNILLAPCQVQGPSAPYEIAAAIRALQRFEEVDVIIVGRGGGSYEDLYCFNDEGVARAIFASRVPVVSAVGHETDFTIADFAADLRAPTPSAAAELCCPDYYDLIVTLSGEEDRLESKVQSALSEARRALSGVASSAAMAGPKHALGLMRERLRSVAERADTGAKSALMNAEARLDSVSEKLSALSPMAVMRRGYSIVLDENGRAVSSASRLAKNDRISIRMAEGGVSATVDEIMTDNDTAKEQV